MLVLTAALFFILTIQDILYRHVSGWVLLAACLILATSSSFCWLTSLVIGGFLIVLKHKREALGEADVILLTFMAGNHTHPALFLIVSGVILALSFLFFTQKPIPMIPALVFSYYSSFYA